MIYYLIFESCIYVYLFNRYYANGCQPVVVTMAQIKNYVGAATTTTSNNGFIDDTIDILKRLQLLDMELCFKDGKSFMLKHCHMDYRVLTLKE